ncbi:MAG: hypothetical protein ACI9HK_002360 [Pirellulaceae bacterium]|jgi:hypothetical protein
MNRLKTLFSGKSQKNRNRRQRTLARNMNVEALESRQMLAIAYDFIANPDLGGNGNNISAAVTDNVDGSRDIEATPGATLEFAIIIETDADVTIQSAQINVVDSAADAATYHLRSMQTTALGDGGWIVQASDPAFTPANGGPFPVPLLNLGGFPAVLEPHWFFTDTTDQFIAPDGAFSAFDGTPNLAGITKQGAPLDLTAGDRIPLYAFSVEVPALGESMVIDIRSIAEGANGAFRTVVVDASNGADVPISNYQLVTITGSNLGPSAVDDTVPGTEDVTTVIPMATLTANDARFDTFDSVGNPSVGSVAINGANVEFTAPANFNGPATFDYQITGGGVPATAEVTVNVAPVNDPPTLVDDAANVTEGTIATGINVLGNDSDIDLDNLTITGVTGSANASTDGTTITYDATGDTAPASVTLSYTVSDGTTTSTADLVITVVTNQPPVANGDMLTNVPEDGSGTLLVATLLGNDTDPEDDTITLVSILPNADATVLNNGNGTWTVTPNANFSGQTVLDYQITDGTSTSTGTITVTVDGANDPVVAVDDDVLTSKGVAIIGFDVLANDLDPDNDVLSLVSIDAAGVINGTLTNNNDGTFDYSPTLATFVGTDSFTYVVSDGATSSTGTVTIEVLDRNDPPVAVADTLTVIENTTANAGNVTANDTDDNNNVIFVAFGAASQGSIVSTGNGGYEYTPTPGVFNVTDTITYTISDGFNPDVTSTLTITISEVNDPPVANTDNANTIENTPTTISVLANDTDPDGAALVVFAVTDGAKGTVVNNGNGTVTYTPNANEFGADSFTYTVSDSLGLTDVGTVNISIVATNDRPSAVDDAGAGDEDTDITVDVLANDTDPDNDTLSIQIVSVTNGTASGASGQLVFTPNANFNGTAEVEYVASDSLALSNVALVTITVNPVNDNPDAIDDRFTAATNSVLNVFTPLGNDLVFPDFGETLIITGADAASVNGGIVAFDAGTVTYSPPLDFEGIDSFDYTISDENGGVDTATISVIASRQRYFRSGNDLIFVGLDDGPDRVRVQALTNDNLNIQLRTDEGTFGPLPLGPGGVLQIYTFGGNDVVTSSAVNVPLYVEGGVGNDILQGLTSADVLLGGPGNDIIQGGGGNDILIGGTGNDLLVGRDGDETLIGNEGNDTLQGSSGSDELWGGPGNDRLSGGSGSDFIDGGDDDDTMVGGGGDDILIGGEGSDSLKGEAGNDLVIGGLGDDGVNGGKNQDALIGGEVAGDTATLYSLLAAWASAPNNATARRDALWGAGLAVTPDAGVDNLIGGGGGDYFGDGENFVDFRSRNDI